MGKTAPHLTNDQLSATLYLTVKHIKDAKKNKVAHKIVVDEAYLNSVKLCLESIVGEKYSEVE